MGYLVFSDIEKKHFWRIRKKIGLRKFLLSVDLAQLLSLLVVVKDNFHLQNWNLKIHY